MRFTLTPGAGSNSYIVITGPGCTVTTRPADAEVRELLLEDPRVHDQAVAVVACAPPSGGRWKIATSGSV